MAKASIDGLPRSRKEAIEREAKWYFSGQPCPEGHIDRRKTRNGGCAECNRTQDRVRYAKNLDKFRSKGRARYHRNKDRVAEKNRERTRLWHLNNREASRLQQRIVQRNRRARKIVADGSHTSADIAAIRRSQKDRCGYCSVALRRSGEVDHIKALSKGGENSRRNLQLLCAPCNRRKSSRDPIEFAQSIGLLV